MRVDVGSAQRTDREIEFKDLPNQHALFCSAFTSFWMQTSHVGKQQPVSTLVESC